MKSSWDSWVDPSSRWDDSRKTSEWDYNGSTWDQGYSDSTWDQGYKNSNWDQGYKNSTWDQGYKNSTWDQGYKNSTWDHGYKNSTWDQASSSRKQSIWHETLKRPNTCDLFDVKTPCKRPRDTSQDDGAKTPASNSSSDEAEKVDPKKELARELKKKHHASTCDSTEALRADFSVWL